LPKFKAEYDEDHSNDEKRPKKFVKVTVPFNASEPQEQAVKYVINCDDANQYPV
jgi:hypothetical protein